MLTWVGGILVSWRVCLVGVVLGGRCSMCRWLRLGDAVYLLWTQVAQVGIACVWLCAL